MNSLVIVLFLSGMVAMIMLRTLHKDIARYNQVDQVKALLSSLSVGADPDVYMKHWHTSEDFFKMLLIKEINQKQYRVQFEFH